MNDKHHVFLFKEQSRVTWKCNINGHTITRSILFVQCPKMEEHRMFTLSHTILSHLVSFMATKSSLAVENKTCQHPIFIHPSIKDIFFSPTQKNHHRHTCPCARTVKNLISSQKNKFTYLNLLLLLSRCSSKMFWRLSTTKWPTFR